MDFISKVAGLFIDPNKKVLDNLKLTVEKVNRKEKQYKTLDDEGIKKKTNDLRERLKNGEKKEDILPDAFANCREAALRVLGQRAYDTQLMGAIVLHEGKIAEMKTGEGKTLSSVHAAYLNALDGKGVHIITVNDYLARRDANWMGAVYDFLGLSVGCIQGQGMAYIYEKKVNPDVDEVSIEYENLRQVSKKEAYAADITYGTNNEFGFDYLRDNMVLDVKQMEQVRDVEDLVKFEKQLMKKTDKISNNQKKQDLKKDYLNFAIVDEVDSILIDEARTPLIISAPDTESAQLYQKFATLVPKLEKEKDYNIDEKLQAISLTDKGISKMEKLLGVDNLYESSNMRYVHHLHQALKAHAIFKRDKQYMIKDGEIMIVDEFTGRVMPGRRFSEGLHQALEAKEGVKVQRESKTMATITFQNFFRLYKKLAGMTGTAMTSAEEFSKVYSLDIVAIPTHKEMIREDRADRIYKTEHVKFEAIVEDIKKRNKKRQPVLVGTVSVDKSERLAQYLDKTGVEYEILNAKNHEREAQIVAKAGQKGAVTISTNMAGRGTDIKLGKGVAELGGLYVVGTERHEARRIDNQLRGRSGRQGDPGVSQFYISLEDELVRRFAMDKIKALMDRFGLPDNQVIENKMISRQIESAQKKIEGFNFDIRKHVLEYDDVINRQREAIYQRRRRILLDLYDAKEVVRMIKLLIKDIVASHTQGEVVDKWNIKEIYEYANSLFKADSQFEEELRKIQNDHKLDKKERRKALMKKVVEYAVANYNQKEKEAGQQALRKVEKVIMLRTIDQLWVEHLDNMQFLREGVGLRGYGQRDPLIEYKREGYEMYQDLLANIRLQVVESLFKVNIQVKKKNQDDEPQEIKEAAKEANKPADFNLSGGPSDDRDSLLFNASFNRGEGAERAAIKEKKVGRNEACPCGSGRKYKKCCGRKS
ncbi:MAG: preprotein translocase subunit SecA [Candidatus Moranbacteria bacterium]|nr:preprotein translocase subunit SecA [Candidatus Moranbacteria bacterium]